MSVVHTAPVDPFPAVAHIDSSKLSHDQLTDVKVDVIKNVGGGSAGAGGSSGGAKGDAEKATSGMIDQGKF